MNDKTIINYINDNLDKDDQVIAIDFIFYLESKNLTFYKDNGICWKDKIYYWVKHKDSCVCFIAIKDPEEPHNSWTVWSDDMGSSFLADSIFDEKIKEIGWKHVGHCGHCGSCPGGRHKIIFGKEFDDICGCTFRVDNPTTEDLMFLKEIVDIRIKEIDLIN